MVVLPPTIQSEQNLRRHFSNLKKLAKKHRPNKGKTLEELIKKTDNEIDARVNKLINSVQMGDMDIIKNRYKQTAELLVKKLALEIKLLHQTTPNEKVRQAKIAQLEESSKRTIILLANDIGDFLETKS